MNASRKMIVAGWMLAIVIGTAGVFLWQRESVTLWYHSWKLQSATTDHYPAFVSKFEGFGLSGTDALVKQLSSTDEVTCQNAGQVLTRILQVWGTQDSRRDQALKQVEAQCPQFSPPGQHACMAMIQQLLQDGQPTEMMAQVVGSLATRLNTSLETRLELYETMIQLLRQDQNVSETLQKQARHCVQTGIRDDNVQVRLAAVRLAVTPALQLHAELVPMVSGAKVDPAPEVRQLVLLALGEHEQLIATDELCRFLQDGNAEVRGITERALKLRGLNQNQLKLARMINDPDPSTRAQLPALVFNTSDVDAVQWMERLCKDPMPAVRAASARAMGEHQDQRLQSLMQQLSEKDQDASVQQIARFYWKAER